VLQVYGSDHADPLIEQIFNVLPAMLVFRARRVIKREFVDQANAGLALHDGINVHACTAADLAQWNYRQFAQITGNATSVSGLQRAHNNIRAAAFPAAAFIEHAAGFPDTRRVSQEDLEPATFLFALLELNAPQQLFGVRA
jgi:hypothetical protein